MVFKTGLLELNPAPTDGFSPNLVWLSETFDLSFYEREIMYLIVWWCLAYFQWKRVTLFVYKADHLPLPPPT